MSSSRMALAVAVPNACAKVLHRSIMIKLLAYQLVCSKASSYMDRPFLGMTRVDAAKFYC